MQTARGIEEDGVIALFLRIRHCALGCFQGAGLHAQREHFHADALTQRLQLFDRGRTNDVAGNQQRPASLLLLHQVGDLRAGRRLTSTLQTDHHHRRDAILLIMDLCLFRSQQIGDLIMDDLDDHLAGVE